MEAEFLPDRKLFLLFRSLETRCNGKQEDSIISMEGNEEGLKMWTDYLGIISTRLYLPRSLFAKLVVRKNDTAEVPLFHSRLSLIQFLQALKVCKPVMCDGSREKNSQNTSLSITVSDISDKMTLRTVDTEISKISINCSLPLIAPIEHSTSNTIFFDDSDVILRILTEADLFISWLKSVDFADKSSLSIDADDHLPTLELSLESPYGIEHVTITDFSQTISHSFIRPASFTYNPQLWINALKYCGMASKVSLRINGEGIVSFQLMLAIKNETAFLEYIISPLAT